MKNRERLILACLVLFLACSASERPRTSVQNDPWSRGHSSRERQLLELGTGPVHSALIEYFNNTGLEAHMRGYVERCSAISRLFSIGRSVEGRDLWALEISNRPGLEQAKPSFKYVANMHGDEPSGRQLLLALAEWLCANHAADERAKRIVEDMHLFILPSMNPDGFERRQRGNARQVDLNRDFPDPFERGSAGIVQPSGREQPETLALMTWIRSRHFVGSASLHEGALVANYPWDGTADKGTHYSSAPDDAAFQHLAHVYADAHAKMHASHEFKGGITNGAHWYPLWGGMQDWNYIAGDCLELTLELAPNKWPPAEHLPGLFEDNLPAMLALPLVACFGGIRGFVREHDAKHGRLLGEAGSAAKGRPLGATIHVSGINKTVSASSTFGDFYRPLAPGTYNVTAMMAGYLNKTVTVAVPADGSGETVELFMERAGLDALTNWSLARKFGPLREGTPGPVAFSEAVNARIVQNVVFLMAGLAVLLLLRAVHHRFYAPRARQPIPGGLHSTPRRSPMRGA
ncbi:g3689 [Coccomyxa elongata]